MDSNEEFDVSSDWKRLSILDSYGQMYKDSKKAELLSSMPDALDGSTCAEVEDRYLNLLNFSNNFDESRSAGVSPVIAETTVSISGSPGRDFYMLDDNDQYRFASIQSDGEPKITIPVLEIQKDQSVYEDGSQIEQSTVLVKNPFNRIKGETFPLVQVGSGLRAPVVVGVQNGLILSDDNLYVVEGNKNKDTGRFEWQVKRPAFDNQRYERLDILKEVIKKKTFAVLNPNGNIHEKR